MFKTKFAALSAQSGFMLPGWSKGYKFTLPSGNGDHIQFPCPVYLSPSNFDFTNTKADGSDIRFTDKNLNLLKFERVEHTVRSEYLYRAGDECSAITGGWSTIGCATTNFPNGVAALTKNASTLYGALTAVGSIKYLGTVNKIDVTGYKNLCIDASYTAATNTAAYLALKSTADANPATAPVKYTYYDSTGAKIAVIDVSGLTGTYYVFAEILNNSSSGTGGNFTVNNIWLEGGTANPPTNDPNNFAEYNVLLPAVSNTTGAEFYMWVGNANAFNDSIEAWQDKTGKQLTYNGNVKLLPNVAKFGKAAYFDGTGDYMSIPHSVDLQFGSGNFTIEAWIYPLSVATNGGVFCKHVSGIYGEYYLYFSATGILRFVSSTNGTSYDISLTASKAISPGKLYHIEISRSGSIFNLFINGEIVATTTNSGSIVTAGNYEFLIGQQDGSYFNGYIDEVVVSKGVARHTANFTPPTVPYTVDANTKLLMHFDDGEAMRIATSTTGTDSGYFNKSSLITASNTTVVEAKVRIETGGSITSQMITVRNGVKGATFSIGNGSVICNSLGITTSTVTMDTISEYHIYKIKFNGTTNAEFYIDDVLRYAATYANLCADSSTNSIYWGDGNTTANWGGSAVYQYFKYNLDYVSAPTDFITWLPSQGLPSANGWTATGTASLATLLFKDETGKTTYTYGDVKPVKTAYTDGARSAYFDGAGDYLYNSYPVIQFGASNFSVDVNFMYTSLTSGVICAHWTSASNYWDIYYDNTNKRIYFEVYIDASNRGVFNCAFSPTINTEYSIEFTRSGSSGYISINGIQQTTTVSTAFVGNLNYSGGICVGGRMNDNTSYMTGYVFGVRITSGRARHTANFTPPTTFTIDGSDVVFCTNFDTIYDQDYSMVQHMGDSLVDATGNGNNGTATGTTVVNTEFGKARNFNGTSDLISCGTGTMPSISKFTILQLAFLRTDGTYNGLFGKTNATTRTSTNPYITVEMTNTNTLYTSIGGGGSELVATAPSFTNSAYCAVASKYDGVNLKLLLDGATSATSLSGSVTGNMANPLYLGYGGVTTTNYNDNISETRISSIDRSDNRIKIESLALKNSLLAMLAA